MPLNQGFRYEDTYMSLEQGQISKERYCGIDAYAVNLACNGAMPVPVERVHLVYCRSSRHLSCNSLMTCPAALGLCNCCNSQVHCESHRLARLTCLMQTQDALVHRRPTEEHRALSALLQLLLQMLAALLILLTPHVPDANAKHRIEEWTYRQALTGGQRRRRHSAPAPCPAAAAQ